VLIDFVYPIVCWCVAKCFCPLVPILGVLGPAPPCALRYAATLGEQASIFLPLAPSLSCMVSLCSCPLQSIIPVQCSSVAAGYEQGVPLLRSAAELLDARPVLSDRATALLYAARAMAALRDAAVRLDWDAVGVALGHVQAALLASPGLPTLHGALQDACEVFWREWDAGGGSPLDLMSLSPMWAPGSLQHMSMSSFTVSSSTVPSTPSGMLTTETLGDPRSTLTPTLPCRSHSVASCFDSCADGTVCGMVGS
jgi:hypothetical protein